MQEVTSIVLILANPLFVVKFLRRFLYRSGLYQKIDDHQFFYDISIYFDGKNLLCCFLDCVFSYDFIEQYLQIRKNT